MERLQQNLIQKTQYNTPPGEKPDWSLLEDSLLVVFYVRRIKPSVWAT